jgi:hypothetical protein
MIELNITQTAKSYGAKEYESFNSYNKSFHTLAEAKNWLKEEYGNVKRSKMFVDKTDGSNQHIGYIYGFKNKDYSHNTNSWLQQDWVEFSKVTYSRITL